MSKEAIDCQSTHEAFRTSMRLVASSVSLVTASDPTGTWCGMAVTSAGSLSMDPASMMVAVNRTASIHPVILQTGRFTLNLIAETQTALVEPFARSDMRDRRFVPDDWIAVDQGGPILKDALCSHVCTVVETHDFGSHTVFFGTVDQIVLSQTSAQDPRPLLWLNGRSASVSGPTSL